jgi:hypothetical protein
MVSQRGPGSESARLLAVCLEGLRENSATNPGVSKMYNTINRVMDRLGVRLEGSEIDSEAYQMANDELDLTAIIRSFGAEHPLGSNDLIQDMSNGFDQSPLDNLYGFLGFTG